MSVITKIEDWGNSHRPGWLDVFRIVLGCYITYKGFSFLNNIENLEMILIGAVIWVNAPRGFMSLGNHMEFEISLAVLFGLIVFMVFGAGKFSIDERRRKEKAMEMNKMAH
jgi:hypothetical protein